VLTADDKSHLISLVNGKGIFYNTYLLTFASKNTNNLSNKISLKIPERSEAKSAK
jgi:hypothetical protein